MPAFLFDRRDMDFVLYEQLDLAGLAKLEEFKEFSRETFDEVLTQGLQFVKDELAPTSSVADREGCKLEGGKVKVPEVYRRVFKDFAEGGWIAMHRPQKFGGMGLPIPIYVAMTEAQIGGASSFVFFPGLSVAAGHLLENYGKAELRDLIVPKLYNGQWTGTMCLTEPQAGTAVGELKTTATPVEGDEYSIQGTKIFISAGDHDLTENIMHLVLARVPGDPAGTKGISLFAVPKVRFDATGKLLGANDVTTVGLEHKLGINGSPTCQLAFGENGKCRGYLIGERCKGINYMFQMMNEARLVCGIQGAGAANYAYQLALAYARQRIQSPRLTDRGPDAKSVAIIEHPDVRRNLMWSKSMSEGLRALIMRTAFHAEYAEKHPDEAQRAKYADLLELMTPICKAYASDQGFRVTELAVQIHGGYGYTKEYGVEQCLRDVKIASIYEGANGIQALDLLGRKMRTKGGALFMTWMQDINESIEKNKGHATLGAEVDAVEEAKNLLTQVAMGFATIGATDPELAMLGATPFLEMFGHVEVARLLVEQAVLAQTKLDALTQKNGIKPEGLKAFLVANDEARFYDGKVKGARFFVSTVLPHAQALAQNILKNDRSALDVVL